MVKLATNKRPIDSTSDSSPKDSKQLKMAPLFVKDTPKDFTTEFLGKSQLVRGCLHFVYEKPQPSNKIAAFGESPSPLSSREATADVFIAIDLDGTVILTRSGNKFPKDKDDWKLWSNEVKAKLRAVHGEGSVYRPLSSDFASLG